MKINTTLLTNEEKEFLEDLQEYLEICEDKTEIFSECEKNLTKIFVIARWQGDIACTLFEINRLSAVANYRANQILTLCHTGK